MRQQIRTWPGAAGRTRPALLDFVNARISRVANLGTSCRARARLSLSLSFRLVFLLSFGSPRILPGLSLSLFHSSPPRSASVPSSLSRGSLLHCHLFLSLLLLSASRFLLFVRSSSPYPLWDRPSLSVQSTSVSFIPSASHLSLAPSRSRTPSTSCSSSSRPRPRSTYDAAGRPTRNAERVRVRSRARHSRQHAHSQDPPSSTSPAKPAVDAHWIVEREGHYDDDDDPLSTAITKTAISLSKPEINKRRSRVSRPPCFARTRQWETTTLIADDPYRFVQDPLLSFQEAARSIFIA